MKNQTVNFKIFCFLMILSGLYFFSFWSFAQAATNQTNELQEEVENQNGPSFAWSGSFRYGILTNFVEEVSPRTYDHFLDGEISRELTTHWTLGAGLSLVARTVDGQIYMDSQQKKEEVISPSAHIDLSYNFYHQRNWRWKVFASGDTFWDEASRREGYLGLLSSGVETRVLFPHVGYSMGHTLVYSQFFNAYTYNTEGFVNPNGYGIYSWSNQLQIFKGFFLSYHFGIKLTQYLDKSKSYSYNNKYGLSYQWGSLVTALTFENGGFTDQGNVELWYINQYRRIFRLSFAYVF